MTIKIKLTALYTLLTGGILLLFSIIIYLSSSKNREKEFYALLKKECITKANLFFNAKVDARILQSIYRNNRKILHEVEVAIYDTSFQLLYHDAVDIDKVKETPDMLREILKKNEIRFYLDDWQVIGMIYPFNNVTYILTATALDQYGYNKLFSLRKNLLLFFAITITLVFISGLLFSKNVLQPIKDITSKAKDITAYNLHLRLPHTSNKIKKDELNELTLTINQMLDRLENSFEAQKTLVYHISHELRTPLSAILTEVELSLVKNYSTEEYKKALSNILNDTKKTIKFLNDLLNLAKVSYDNSEIAFKQIRIDEILLEAYQELKRSNPSFNINLQYNTNQTWDEPIPINGNEYLLKTAFINLMENACKYSDNHTCEVIISFIQPPIQQKKYILQFIDQGIGIESDEIENIFKPFYRGNNKTKAEGNGLGLFLTKKIIELHRGEISVLSKVGKGTTIEVKL
ncbi:MAG: HAMP domain-containing histidine kinase [Flavobacteriales bacterium]|nr:HAMP domain-containing histidine kinase [Flavobacteriales bacterium]